MNRDEFERSFDAWWLRLLERFRSNEAIHFGPRDVGPGKGNMRRVVAIDDAAMRIEEIRDVPRQGTTFVARESLSRDFWRLLQDPQLHEKSAKDLRSEYKPNFVEFKRAMFEEFERDFLPSDRSEAVGRRPQSNATILSDIAAAEGSLRPLSPTERETVVQARVGQGRYRSDLIDLWGGCSVTDCRLAPMLRASHLKPWRDCGNAERLDPFNGLLLTPNLDQALDALLISFADDGAIKLSRALQPREAEQLGLVAALRLRFVREEHKPYLAEHRARFAAAERGRHA